MGWGQRGWSVDTSQAVHPNIGRIYQPRARKARRASSGRASATRRVDNYPDGESQDRPPPRL